VTDLALVRVTLARPQATQVALPQHVAVQTATLAAPRASPSMFHWPAITFAKTAVL
jgi:hypothetical protein